MKRALIVLALLAALLSSCVAPPSLWGIAATPTLDAPSINPFIGEEQPPTLPAATNSPIVTESTPTPPPAPTQEPVTTLDPSSFDPDSTFLYYSQSGDMLSAVAARFNVAESEITSDADLSATTLLAPNTLLIIPNRIAEETTPNVQVLPDVEFIYSATSIGFNTEEFVLNQGGYLNTFKDYLGSVGKIPGYAAIDRLAEENSISPRLLLALLEHEAGWVRGQPNDLLHTDYPMGFNDYRYKGMSVQLAWAINTMSIAYYGWRAGTIEHVVFPDGGKLRFDPRLNAATVALQYFFAKLYNQAQWSQIVNSPTGFAALHQTMFDDAWSRADLVGPIFPPGLIQPPLTLPFEIGSKWSFTGGPHNGWGIINPAVYGQAHSIFSAIDFAPAGNSGCSPSNAWAVAAAPGLVVRSENGVVILDLDGDGYEQTGWNLLYLHLSNAGRIPVGTYVEVNDRLGHPSCEGGVATGAHLHFARKYNGEWVTADGPIPFVMSGWRLISSGEAYKGKLIKDNRVVIADQLAQAWSNIVREDDDE